MCTLIILRRPGHDWPTLIAANRDEMSDRPWDGPGRHWPDRAHVIAGRDQLAGGTWLGLNDDGVVAGVLNRHGTLGPKAGKRSRGELPLDALDHAEAEAAADALADLDGAAYRAFNLVVADAANAYWIANNGDSSVSVHVIPDGLSMVTAADLNDTSASLRIRRYLPRFRGAAIPEIGNSTPDGDDWRDWQALLSDERYSEGGEVKDAMCFATETGFATVSSSLIALPKAGQAGMAPCWRFAPGPPHKAAYGPVDVTRPRETPPR